MDPIDRTGADAEVEPDGLPPGLAATARRLTDDPADGGEDRAADFDPWTALEAVTQDTRASLVADVVGHPRGAPSVVELDYTNPDVGRSTVEWHLRKLVAAGVLDKEQLPPGGRTRDLPYTFYRLTGAARDLFDRAGVFDEDVRREQYARVEKSAAVLAAQAAPRPEGATGGRDHGGIVDALATLERRLDALDDRDALDDFDDAGDVSDLVEELVRQVRTLALDARVESARTGTDGERFPVVAQEVRALADELEALADDLPDGAGEVRDRLESLRSLAERAGEAASGDR